MPANPPSSITLAYSQNTGLVAIARGEQYQWARSALEQAGFAEQADGSHLAPDRDIPASAAKLLPIAHRHRTEVEVSTRPYLGDVADRIAVCLPGAWTAQIEIYSHPVWQHDLLPYLWDRGELVQAVEQQRVPYAAKLTSDSGIELLLAEREQEHGPGYLVGALASRREFEDSHNDPYAPNSIVLSVEPGPAAQAIDATFLPAYHRALHIRRLDTVTAALGSLRAQYGTLTAMHASEGFSDKSQPISADPLQAATRAAAGQAWTHFHRVLTLAPGVLENCALTTEGNPADADVVQRLSDALASCGASAEVWRIGQRDLPFYFPSSREHLEQLSALLGLQVLPALGIWLAEYESFVRIAKAAGHGGPRQPAPLPAPPVTRAALPPASPSGRH